MHNNPEEHRFQYSMTVGLRNNRNRMPQVVNMKLYKMNRKTDQDKQQIRKAVMHKDMGRKVWMQRCHLVIQR